jgi:hypothetical protein
MTNSNSSTILHLKENLKGRIDNLAMSPSYANTLIPVFEAIMNSIHSVQERFGEEWARKGKIRVTVHQEDEGNPHSFTIEDNGQGLNNDNFESFQTYDSRYKISKGGKGVGRLTWLKVFESIQVSSIFEENETLMQRKFDFVLDNKQAFQNYELTPSQSSSNVQTFINLKKLKSGYNSQCPKKLETIAHRIIAHFLPFLISKECPDISVLDANSEFKLQEIILKHTYASNSDIFQLEDYGNFEIKHILINKQLVEKQEHTIYLSAHARIVTDHIINNQTGLDTAFEYNGNQVVYVGIISSSFLDDNVTQERNNFDISKNNFKLITKEGENLAKEYLKDPINSLIEAKAITISRVINNFPRYGYLVKDKKDFAQKLPLNRKTEEDIYREMSVYDYRATKDVKYDLQSIVSTDTEFTSSEAFKQKLDEFMGKIGEQEQASLAEYVSKRKLIIDVLEARLGYEDKEKKTLHTEEAIHKVICPLRVNSGEIEYGSHNLWLIDDRLAYYDFWASDENIKKYAISSDCKERPDLILFQGSNLLQRAGTSQPIVIVEFKRPARKDYNDDENPIKQVYDYIRALRENKITDNNGRLITEIGTETPFFCYLICDITPRLLSILEDYEINQRLPGGRGYFGFNKSRGAYIEVLQYDQIVKDARLRHEAFFRTLGIN